VRIEPGGADTAAGVWATSRPASRTAAPAGLLSTSSCGGDALTLSASASPGTTDPTSTGSFRTPRNKAAPAAIAATPKTPASTFRRTRSGSCMGPIGPKIRVSDKRIAAPGGRDAFGAEHKYGSGHGHSDAVDTPKHGARTQPRTQARTRSSRVRSQFADDNRGGTRVQRVRTHALATGPDSGLA
jgi:hypothetical protein